MTVTIAGKPIGECPIEDRIAAATEHATVAIQRYGRISTFHPAEEAGIYLALADTLVILEEDGVEALATREIDGKQPVPEVWRHVKRLAHRAMLICRVPYAEGYFYAGPPCDGTRTCRCLDCR